MKVFAALATIKNRPSGLFWRMPMKDVIQPRALATRDKITRAAARLFALKGYHDTTLEDVRRAAEVTTGAFFHHFASKEDLGFAVLDQHMEWRRQELDQLEQEMSSRRPDDPLERSVPATGRHCPDGLKPRTPQGWVHHRQPQHIPHRHPRDLSPAAGELFRRDGDGIPAAPGCVCEAAWPSPARGHESAARTTSSPSSRGRSCWHARSGTPGVCPAILTTSRTT